MSLDNPFIIDAAAIENSSGNIILTIADSWEWNDELLHLQALQEKINMYFAYIESGQVWESFPDKTEEQIVIEIVCRFTMPTSGIQLVIDANEAAMKLNTILRHRVYFGDI